LKAENFETIVHSKKEMEAAAREIGKKFPDVHIFTLYGEMGSGKTTFVKAFCKWLGIKDIVNSPTFSIVNEYGSRPHVFHFDLYRLKNEQELLDIGFEEYTDIGDSYLFIEWPEMALPYLPECGVEVHLETLSDENRRLVCTRQ
jgi:tRNA threonylcarbamoyladenosine biosynthesis protein TsaE